jgi:hypothetical protein
MDSFEGHKEEPLGLHKYLYAGCNPANRIDPSGHDDLVELMSTAAIDAGLSAIVSVGINYTVGTVAVSLIPQRVRDGLATAAVPDALLFALSGTRNLKYGIGGTGGIELLVSPKTFGWALYGYLGGSFNGSSGVQGAFGFVFNCRNSSKYTEGFTTISVPYRRLPAAMQRNIDRFLASGFGATVCDSSTELIQEAQSLGLQLSSVVDKTTVNIFFDWSVNVVGFCFSHPIGPPTDAPSPQVSLSETWYWQLAPDNPEVRFR